jgi:septal ring factor EnvC (AmiA/AmiB activator)
MKTFAALLGIVFAGQAMAQDIRGLEVCTAEKQMERRTGCLQANVEFLQQALTKQAQQARAKFAATERELYAAKVEIAALKSSLARLDRELAQLKTKTETGKK